MRFTGERQLRTPREHLWEALHTGEVLRAVIPGCERLTPCGVGTYVATLAARVGPVADTYRGSFTITDLRPGSALQVAVEGKGRCGRLELDLQVLLAEGLQPHSTTLRYDASARVGGLVARLGAPTLTVAGGHLTGSFFRDLDRTLTAAAVGVPAQRRAPAYS